MKEKYPLIKKILIGVLLFIITILHITASEDNMALHVLHRELYFLPILLTSFWFGLNAGFIISLVVGFLYSSYILAFSVSHVGLATVIPQVFVFVLVGTVLGWLADKEKALAKKRLEDDNIIVLGRAASAVAHEMKDILKAMKTLLLKAGGLEAKEFSQDFESEMSRLDRMIDILSSYARTEEGRMFSHDLNRIIQNRINHFEKVAAENGIFFEIKLDPDGCPSWIDPNKITWILDKLIENAMEVSSSGNKIYLTSRRGGEFCTLSVRDEGPGIKPEHLGKIFTPFFTTKPNGQGLDLAGCRKSIHDMGGEISVASTLGKGAEFTVLVPREEAGKSLAQDTIKAVLRGQRDTPMSRE
ncbi:MAG: HAMP domain-containing sensor histidine kinase [Desulfobulbaceae bacterium]|nr:HAMP domain-containing sensor histidine kinase [Desulfobulbaceae bacterium]